MEFAIKSLKKNIQNIFHSQACKLEMSFQLHQRTLHGIVWHYVVGRRRKLSQGPQSRSKINTKLETIGLVWPPPWMPVTTRVITCLGSGIPNLTFTDSTVTERGPYPNHCSLVIRVSLSLNSKTYRPPKLKSERFRFRQRASAKGPTKNKICSTL